MITLGFLGDINLNNKYIQYAQDGINPFVEIEDILGRCDLVIGNLEALLEGENGENELKIPRLKTTKDALNYLKIINVGIVSLANNHVYDNLESGYQKTVDFLNKENISYCGTGFSKQEAEKPLIKLLNGKKLAFISAVSGDTNPCLPNDALVMVNYLTIEKLTNQINTIRKDVDFVILLLHWGGKFEGGFFPSIDQNFIAKKLIDAGADCIIGHHSHTLQPFEIYKGKHIWYSLGNFCVSDFAYNNHHYNFANYNYYSCIPLFKLDRSIDLNQIVHLKNSISRITPSNKSKKYSIRLFIYHLIRRFHGLYYLYILDYKYFRTTRNLFLSSKLSLRTKISYIKSKMF